jgi:hypothetical protein
MDLLRFIHRFGRHRALVRVPAESLYEAAVEAIAAFRRSVLAEMPLGPGTRLTISVKAPEEEHMITIGKARAREFQGHVMAIKYLTDLYSCEKPAAVWE